MNQETDPVVRMISEIQPERYLRLAVLAVVCLSFANMLYCTLEYEFGWGPKTVLAGPTDRFADLIKDSLSYRVVTAGADRTQAFHSWNPLYQQYYEHPIYGGVEAERKGLITHLQAPPVPTLIFLFCGSLIVHSGSPPLALYLFFLFYLCEAACIAWIAIPRAKRTWKVTAAVLFLCLASYPALVIFGRANYVYAGTTSLAVVFFLTGLYTRRKASLLYLLALAVAVNIHPNAVIFALAIPLVLGVRRAVKPCLEFLAISAVIFAGSYFASHAVYPDYTIGHFLKGLAIYKKLYVQGAMGIFGSTPYIYFRMLGNGIPFAVKLALYYAAGGLFFLFICFAFWRASKATRTSGASGNWPAPLVPFFLTAFYCILTPVFANYHLLIFLGPVILAYLENEGSEGHRVELAAAVICSVLMLSPKNYSLFRIPLQLLVNPAIVCWTVLWLGMEMLRQSKRRAVGVTSD